MNLIGVFYGFFRIVIPVLVYLMCFVVVFKICSKLCKRRRTERPVLLRVSSVPSNVNLARQIPPRPTPVTIPSAPPLEIVSSSDEGVRQQQQPAETDLESQNPPSYEEVTKDSYNQQLPAYPGFCR